MLMQVIAAHGEKQAQQTIDEYTTKTSEKRRVLVADDPIILRIVTVIAENIGYEMVTASAGYEAFRILQQDVDFNCAIFDMMVPHLHEMNFIHYTKKLCTARAHSNWNNTRRTRPENLGPKRSRRRERTSAETFVTVVGANQASNAG